jgi:hypothetical protein
MALKKSIWRITFGLICVYFISMLVLKGEVQKQVSTYIEEKYAASNSSDVAF